MTKAQFVFMLVLIFLAISLVLAYNGGWIDSPTLTTWASIATILALVAAVAVFIVPAAQRRFKGEVTTTGLSPEQRQRNRQVMLDKVEAIWIKGVLENSLQGAIFIELDLWEMGKAVEATYPWGMELRRTGQGDSLLARGTKPIEVFDEVDHALLILGDPGSGKTTLLLDLGRQAIYRARDDHTKPIPVVFNLSSWADKQEKLADWLTEELHRQYQVPTEQGQAWVKTDALLLLLDGLDEVKQEYRADCVAAINAFRSEQGLTQIVACSRMSDYDALPFRFRLQGAIILQPLSPEQINTYLGRLGESRAGLDRRVAGISNLLVEAFSDDELRSLCYDRPEFEPVYEELTPDSSREEAAQLLTEYIIRTDQLDVLSGLIKERAPVAYNRYRSAGGISKLVPVDEFLAVRQTLRHDAGLQELAQSPLMLSIMTLAYRGKSVEDLRPLSTTKARRKHLFDAYMKTMFERKRGEGVAKFSPKQTRCWLSWLAEKMIENGLTIFYVESLQPIWLNASARQWYIFVITLIYVLCGGLIYVLIGVPFSVLIGVSIGELIKGLGGGLIVGLIVGMGVGQKENIAPTEKLIWSWREIINGLIAGPIAGLFFGLFLGLSEALSNGLRDGLSEALSNGLRDGLIAGLSLGLIGGLIRGSSESEEIETRIEPGQGLKRTLRNGLSNGLIVGLIAWLFFGLIIGLFLGLSEVLPEGLRDGLSVKQIAMLIGGPIVGLIAGLYFGPIFGLFFGLIVGRFFVLHYTLRFILTRQGHLPWNLIEFLNYAAERIFLRRVGAGYIFIHRTLMEYFASLEEE